MKPGDTISIVFIPNHPTNQNRVYDFPEHVRWNNELPITRTTIGKVPGNQIGLVLEINESQGYCKVLFPGGLIGWISSQKLNLVDL